MKKQFLLIFLTFSINIFSVEENSNILKSLQNCDADWLIVGAGPAGIITVGVLLELGVLPDRIIWSDKEFNVGRLSNYHTVPANTKNKSFINFLGTCKTFRDCAPKSLDKLKLLDLEREYPLETIVEPLKEITDCILSKVKGKKGILKSLYFSDDAWNVEINDEKFSSYHVILATGSHPKKLDYSEFNSKMIPLDTALDKSQLEQMLTEEDTVAVVGSSHSAILLLKYLSEIPVKKVINFYNKPLQYAIDMGSWVLNGPTGLKGMTADWAKNVLEKNPPANLIRLESKDETIKEIFPTCTKIIYAIGFEKNDLPTIQNCPKPEYDPTTGIIANRLFGIGIAFPEKKIDPLGNIQYNVGLDSFMEYAKRIVPCWMNVRKVNLVNEQAELLKSFADLFTIELL